jgi:drug/metabolite transporter (DMT)-like permease
MPRMPSSRSFAIPGLLYAATLWGVIWYPYRLLQEAGVSGVASSLLSYALPLLVLGGLHVRDLRAARTSWGWLALLALTAGWTNLAYVLAVLEGEVMRVLLLFYLSPLWTVLFARALLGERLNRVGVLVMLLSLAGAMAMLWPGQDGALPLPVNLAEWLGLSAGLMFALSNVVSRKLAHVAEGARGMAVWAGVAVLCLAGMAFQPGHMDFAIAANVATWGLIALIAAAIASMTYAVQYGLARVPANQAIVIFLFELVAAAASSYWLAGETMNRQEWLGAVMIVAASLFSGHMEDDQERRDAHG